MPRRPRLFQHRANPLRPLTRLLRDLDELEDHVHEELLTVAAFGDGQALKALFTDADVDGDDGDQDGALDPNEFAAALAAMGLKVKKEHVLLLLQRMDTNGDGLMQWEELQEWLNMSREKRAKKRVANKKTEQRRAAAKAKKSELTAKRKAAKSFGGGR